MFKKSSSRREEARFDLRFTIYDLRLVRAATLSLVTLVLLPARADEIFIRANQVGYGWRDPKIAIAFSRSALPETFSVTDAETQRVLFEGKARLMPGVRWGQFETHAELDFSALQQAGRYAIRIGQATSHPFLIGDAYAGLPDQLLEFMRQQRCGYNPWLDVVCHPFDGRTAYGPLTNGTYLDARGGWHDAGDLLKYLITSANATAQMLLAYELNTLSEGRVTRVPNPSAKETGTRVTRPSGMFADHVNSLGQSGANGIPDILDEARWGLEWMLKLRHHRSSFV